MRRRSPGARRGKAEVPGREAVELYDEAPVPYVTFDGQGIIRSINSRATALLGLQRGQGVGMPFSTFVVKEDCGEVLVHLARFRAGEEPSCQVRLRDADGLPVTVRLESRRMQATPDLCWTAVLDVSEQKRAEVAHARLEEAERATRDANVAKDRFIASLSHELRAPLAPLLAAVSGLARSGLSAERQAGLLEIIRRNALREARLVDDLLDVSRIASGKIELRLGVVDLHAVTREAAEMLAQDATARRQTLSLDLEAFRHHVNGDAARLRQVFANLLRNAVKFTQEGGNITVRSWNHENRVAIEVSDDGVGINRDALARIFEYFEQAEGPASPGGLGLGLAISRGLVDLHGGKIAAHSAGRGRGARFVVELTALAAGVTALREESPARRPAKRASRSHGDEILVVEDEPDLAEALLSVLQSEGYRVRTVSTAHAALAADLDNVRVVISDLGLPDLDGRLLVEKLKANHDLKAIALSGYGTEADVRSSQAAGFDQHLTKPVEVEVLLGAIDRVYAL